jgi:hypothetical protein
VRSELALALPQGPATPEILVRHAGTAPVPDEPAFGQLVRGLGVPPEHAWWSRNGEVRCGRFPGRCQLTFAPPWETLDVVVDPQGDAETVGDLVMRSGLTLALEQRGHDFLHASCVSIDGRTVAFVGQTGTGKSTLAALLAEEGAEVLSDDHLRVEIADGEVRCHPGVTAIRLRELTGRRVISPPAPGTASRRLDALVLPALGDVPEPRVSALAAAEAMTLLAGSRGSQPDTVSARRRFRLHGDLLERVPAIRLRLPAGAPLDRRVRERLRETLG